MLTFINEETTQFEPVWRNAVNLITKINNNKNVCITKYYLNSNQFFLTK